MNNVRVRRGRPRRLPIARVKKAGRWAGRRMILREIVFADVYYIVLPDMDLCEYSRGGVAVCVAPEEIDNMHHSI